MTNQQIDAIAPAEDVREAWKRLTLEPLRGARDSRYVDCSAARGANVSQKLRDCLLLYAGEPKQMHLLLTGYRGDGKTTELLQFIYLIGEQYRPLYFNAEAEFDLLDFRLPDFLLGVARAVHERMKEHGLLLPEALVNDVADWFARTVEVVERKTLAELRAEGGAGSPSWFPWVTARLVGALKASQQKRLEVRRELNLGLTELIDRVDGLLSEAVKVSKDTDGKELVLIYDNLDRLKPELAFDLFHTNGRSLRELNCHSIYVVPISLRYQPQAPSLPFEDLVEMPMIPVRKRDGGANDANIENLAALLERRFVPDKIMAEPAETMRSIILASGGLLRDLVRMFRQACSDALSAPGGKITQSVAQRVINTVGETYQRAVVAADHPLLVATYKDKIAENNERTQQLIFNTMILVYDEDGVKWHDVHPALANSQRFQELVSAT